MNNGPHRAREHEKGMGASVADEEASQIQQGRRFPVSERPAMGLFSNGNRLRRVYCRLYGYRRGRGTYFRKDAYITYAFKPKMAAKSTECSG